MNMNSPQFRIFPSGEATAAAVADYLARALKNQPRLRLGLATGNTFVPIYAALVELYQAGDFSFSEVMSFNLDEYIGLPKDHPASFSAYMERHLFAHVDLPAGKGLLPGVEGDIEAASRDYEAEIASGGIDIQVLGIGRNGHIGFNEPGSPSDSRTRKVDLTPLTREANKGDFPPGETVPPSAVTMGISTILDARQIILVAIGASKAQAIQAAFQSVPNPDCPASALQSHANVLIFCDETATSTMRAS
jgi:glucosamine-6-phosphate deaminase